MTKKLLTIALLFPFFCFAQHTLKGNFVPKENFSWAILYQITETGTLYSKDARVVDGLFELSLDSTMPKGTYRLVYGVPQKEKAFDIIYNGAEDISFTFSEAEGVLFTASEENMSWLSYQSEMSGLAQDILKSYETNDSDPDEVMALFTQQSTLQEVYEKNAQNLLVNQFISASAPYIPKKFESLKDYRTGLKNQLISSIDFKDPMLQKSSFIANRLVQYIGGEKDIELVSKAISSASDSYQKNLLHQLWDNYVALEKPTLANAIAEPYLISLAHKLGDANLSQALDTYKRLSIGAKAPNFSWEIETANTKKSQSLHDYDAAKNYILVFWSSSCSHCLAELPKLQKFANTLPKDAYKVIAFGLEEEPYDWKNETYRYPEFEHVLGLGKWENKVGNAYNIAATPTFFVLDTDKNFIKKPEDLESLIEFVNQEMEK